MLSTVLVSPPPTPHPFLLPFASKRVLPHLPTHSCLTPLACPFSEHQVSTGPRAFPPTDAR